MALIQSKLPTRRHLNLIDYYFQEYLREFRDLKKYNQNFDVQMEFVTKVTNIISIASLTDCEDLMTDICKLKGLKQAFETLK